MDMATLVDALWATPDCAVAPPAGEPTVAPPHVLPADLHAFYRLCGGATLFAHADYPITIVAPREVVPANPVIIPGLTDADRGATRDDPSWSWYLAAAGDGGQHLTIDLDPARLGRCYDSFWDRHPADSATIATSFTDLLARLLANRGRHWYWLQPGWRLDGPA